MIDLKVRDLKSASTIFEQVYPEMDSTQYIPSVFNLSSQGVYSCKTPGLTVRCINASAIITPYSDIVQIGSDCIYEKMSRQTAEKNIFRDKNLIHANTESLEIRIQDPAIVGSLSQGYSMLGAHSSHWGHFIAEYYPTFLATLPMLLDDVVIVVPSNYDAIQIELIKFALNFYGKSNKVYFCPLDQSVLIEKLYTSDKSSFLSDHADWISIYDTIVQDFCSKEISKFTGTLVNASSDVIHEKIFLTRRAAYRNILNIDQVEVFFKNNGYTIIDPTDLSHQDRIKVFSGCKELAGIYSSAFFNLIYCPNIERVKIIAPLIRCIDQLILNIFKPGQFTFHVANSCDESTHTDQIISAETCESLLID